MALKKLPYMFGLPEGSKILTRNSRVSAPSAVASTYNLSSGTFTRASAAAWWDGSSVIEYGVDELREPISGWIALEGAGTNYCPQWSDITAWTQGNSVSTTSNAVIGPNQELEADLFESTLVDSYIERSLAAGISDSTSVVLSCFAKGIVGGEDFDVVLGNKSGSLTGTSAALTTSWRRIEHRINSISSGGGDGLARFENSGADTDDACHLWGFCAENTKFATSPIPNTSASSTATRAPDDLRLSAGHPDFFLNGRWVVKLRPDASSADFASQGASHRLFVFSGEADYLQLLVSGGNVSVVLAAGGGSTTTGNITFGADQEITLDVDMASSSITVSGASSGNGTTVGTHGSFPDDTMRVGANFAGSSAYYGLMSKEVTEVA